MATVDELHQAAVAACEREMLVREQLDTVHYELALAAESFFDADSVGIKRTAREINLRATSAREAQIRAEWHRLVTEARAACATYKTAKKAAELKEQIEAQLAVVRAPRRPRLHLVTTEVKS